MISPFRHTNDFMVKIVTTFFETIVVIKEYHCRGENKLSKLIDLRFTLGSDFFSNTQQLYTSIRGLVIKPRKISFDTQVYVIYVPGMWILGCSICNIFLGTFLRQCSVIPCLENNSFRDRLLGGVAEKTKRGYLTVS